LRERQRALAQGSGEQGPPSLSRPCRIIACAFEIGPFSSSVTLRCRAIVISLSLCYPRHIVSTSQDGSLAFNLLLPTPTAIPRLRLDQSAPINLPNPPGRQSRPNTMHFALPPRKTSRPPPYAVRQQPGFRIPPALKNLLRRDKLRLVVLGILGFLTTFWLLGRLLRGGSSSGANLPKVAIGSGAPVVVVTVIDSDADPIWARKIKQNREAYAKRHGMQHSLFHSNRY
jgi:hypothetical protein